MPTFTIDGADRTGMPSLSSAPQQQASQSSLSRPSSLGSLVLTPPASLATGSPSGSGADQHHDNTNGDGVRLQLCYDSNCWALQNGGGTAE
jgi:hypothetical protein